MISSTVRAWRGAAIAADRDAGGDRAVRGAHHVLAHRGEEPVGRGGQVVRRAGLEHHAELVRGEAAEHVAGAHARADAPPDRGDHLVGDAEAVGLVDAREIVDRDQHEAAGAAILHRLVERDGQLLGQRVAVHLAGQPVEARQVGKPLLVIVTLGDDAHDAVRACRPPLRSGKPAAVVLDPEPDRAARSAIETVFGLIRDAAAGVVAAGLRHGVEARGRVLRVEQSRIAAAGRDARKIGDLQHFGGVDTPGEHVGVDAPVVGHEPDRSQDGVRVVQARRSSGIIGGARARHG